MTLIFTVDFDENESFSVADQFNGVSIEILAEQFDVALLVGHVQFDCTRTN